MDQYQKLIHYFQNNFLLHLNLIEISSFLSEYSESSFIFSSSKITIGKIPFLKQLL